MLLLYVFINPYKFNLFFLKPIHILANLFIRIPFNLFGNSNYELEPTQDSSGEEDEDADELETQDDSSIGFHGSQTTRNGLASATLSVRVTPRILVTRTKKEKKTPMQQIPTYFYNIFYFIYQQQNYHHLSIIHVGLNYQKDSQFAPLKILIISFVKGYNNALLF